MPESKRVAKLTITLRPNIIGDLDRLCRPKNLSRGQLITDLINKEKLVFWEA